MRAGLVTLAVLALAAQPAFAQGKTKTAPSTAAIAALEMCETFARGDEQALDDALEAGWDAYDQESESPFVKSYAASYQIAGFGWADLFALVETYPGTLFGYCRIDIADPRGDGEAAIEAIADLERYDGEVVAQDGGHYASLAGDDALLITHWDEIGFVLQLTIITPVAGE